MDASEYISLIYEWQNLILKREGVERDIERPVLLSIPSKPIKIITGFRRTGKSFLAQRIAKKLVGQGMYRIDNVLYLNFEDFRLSETNSAQKLASVYELFLTDIAKSGPKLILLDEIQNVSGWDKFVRTIYEKDDDVRIILTGSNSELLSAELGSNLAGRFIEFSILPFSFKEFLLYRNVTVENKNDYLKNRKTVDKLFSEYVKYGGLPEVFEIATEDAKFSYLRGIVTKVVLDDIVKRFKVDNIDVLERLLNYVLSNIGSVVSCTNIRNRLKDAGSDIKVETVIKYIGYFASALAVLEVNKFEWKQRKVFSTSKKYYAMDLGLAALFRPLKENYSMRLENLVLLHLKRSSDGICYGVNERGREIDFIVRNKDGEWDKYQVCVQPEEHNLARELEVFGLVDKHLQKGKNYFITLKDSLKSPMLTKHKIVHLNLIGWLLGI